MGNEHAHRCRSSATLKIENLIPIAQLLTSTTSSTVGYLMARSKPKLAASHQRSWMWGRHAVTETLAAARWPILELLLAEDAEDSLKQLILAEADDRGIKLQIATAARIQQLTASSDHQGIAARMAEFPYGDFPALARLVQSLTDNRTELDRPPLVLICDRIQDAHNFGAILRCCDGVAVDAIVIADTMQAMVTPHVARSSVGAVNHLRIFRVPDLIETVQLLKSKGLAVVAASEKSAVDHWNCQLRQPIALIVGNEANGVDHRLLQQCVLTMRIPMLGRIESLNAAVAAGILLYEIRRQLV